MTQQELSAYSTPVALQISHDALSAEMWAFYCKHSQQGGYKEEWPPGLHQFLSFCLVKSQWKAVLRHVAGVPKLIQSRESASEPGLNIIRQCSYGEL